MGLVVIPSPGQIVTVTTYTMENFICAFNIKNCFRKIMRNYIRKTQRGKTPVDVFERAANEVLVNKKSLRTVAADFEINHMTLQRFCKKQKQKEDEGNFLFYAFFMISSICIVLICNYFLSSSFLHTFVYISISTFFDFSSIYL